MTTKTLKKLIEMEAEKLDFNFNKQNFDTNRISIQELKQAYHKITLFKEGVIKLLDLFDEENSVPAPSPIQPFGQPYIYPLGATLEGIPDDEVPYGTICPCNPANGGSGICGCIMGNRMVKNPKKYGRAIVTGTTNVQSYPPGTTITNTAL